MPNIEAVMRLIQSRNVEYPGLSRWQLFQMYFGARKGHQRMK